MKRFLRFLMLVLMVAYGTASWGSYVKFNGKDSWSGTTASKTNDGVTINLSLANGTFSSGKYGRLSTAKSFSIPAGSTFTISCSTGKIVYIAFSMDNGYVGNSQNNSNNNWTIQTGGGGLHSTSNYSGHGDWWSQSYWEKDDNSNGESKVVFYNGNNHATRLRRMYVYVVTDSETAASNVALSVTGTQRFETSSIFTITTTSGNKVYYTTDGNTPTTSSSNGDTGTTGTVSNSCVVQALTYTTYNPVSSNDGDDKPESGNTSVKKWYSTSKVFTRYYNAPVKGPASTDAYYGTLCYPQDVKVPEGCTAATYVYNSDGTATAGTTYSNRAFIPANTPVLIYSTSSGNKACDWRNTANGENTQAANPGTNNLEGNNGTTMPDEDSDNYIYYGLMEPTDAQAGSPRNLKFGFYLFNYQGTRGDIPAYKAYLKVPRSAVSSSAKGGFSLDPNGFGDTTTGIRVMQTTTNGASGRQGQSVARYNLSGQRVGNDYKGIVIVNGRKMVVK